jgi:hypothetical protein
MVGMVLSLHLGKLIADGKDLQGLAVFLYIKARCLGLMSCGVTGTVVHFM